MLKPDTDGLVSKLIKDKEQNWSVEEKRLNLWRNAINNIIYYKVNWIPQITTNVVGNYSEKVLSIKEKKKKPT